MHLLLTTIFILTSIRNSMSVISSCPPVENIHPCICQRVQPKTSETWITCTKLSSLRELTVIMKSLRNYVIDKFVLKNSNIGFIPSNLFHNISVTQIWIEEVSLSSITQSEETAFLGLENILETLSIRRCNLRKEIEWDRISSLHSLDYLDLSYNKIESAPVSWYKISNPNLKSIYLVGNHILNLPDNAFAEIFELTVLNLSQNKLKTLKRSMFPETASSLTIIDLSDNEISYLPEDTFNRMPLLRRIHVQNNKLQQFHENVWKPVFSVLTHIDLGGNKIKCDRSICWTMKIQKPDYYYGNCASPPNLENRLLSSVNYWDIEYNCDVEIPPLIWNITSDLESTVFQNST